MLIQVFSEDPMRSLALFSLIVLAIQLISISADTAEERVEMSNWRNSQKTKAKSDPKKLVQSSDEEADKAFWEVIEGSDDIGNYESYLEWFPNGKFTSRAKSEIERLKGKGSGQQKVGQKETPSHTGKFKPGQTFKDCDVCPEMVVVPAGEFMMGSQESEEGRDKDEGPLHKVTISKPFAVGKYEVTFEEWDACVDDGDCTFAPWDQKWGRGKRPVIGMSWLDVTEQYIPWLNRKTSKTYRLPTEAEWEYAARANTQTPFWWGTAISTDLANYNGSVYIDGVLKGPNRKKTVPVDSFEPNAFGLYNVHGNAWEWVEDCWHDSYKGAPNDGSSWLGANNGNCGKRIFRGGNYDTNPGGLRSANRGAGWAGKRSLSFGFRIAR